MHARKRQVKDKLVYKEREKDCRKKYQHQRQQRRKRYDETTENKQASKQTIRAIRTKQKKQLRHGEPF